MVALTAIGVAAPAQADVPRSGLYDVTIRGNADGIPFQRTGTLYLLPTITRTTTNGVNPVDVCLFSGSPFTSPQTGAIWLHSNSYCVNTRGARLDMARVSMSRANSRMLVQPDPSISAVGVNGFNNSSGLLANVYQIFGGYQLLEFRNGGRTVVGTIDVVGTGAIFDSENHYRATLVGRARSFVPR